MRGVLSLRLSHRWWSSWAGRLSVPESRVVDPRFGSARKPLRWFDLLSAAGTAALVGVLLKVFVVDVSRVPSGSMVPALLPGDYVVVSRVAYGVGLPPRLPLLDVRLPTELRWWYRSPHRWDIVVLDFPGLPGQRHPDTPQYFIKRVVGLPGDTLWFAGDTLVINHTAYWLPGMREQPRRIVVPYRGMVLRLAPQTAEQWLSLLQREGVQVELRGGVVYRDGSPVDSYTVQQDYFFVMGDNYRTSWDSRHWGVVPRSAVIGKAVAIFYSRDENGRIRWARIGRLLR